MIVKLLVKVLILREKLSDTRDIEEEKGEGDVAKKNGGRASKKHNGSLQAHEDKKKK